MFRKCITLIIVPCIAECFDVVSIMWYRIFDISVELYSTNISVFLYFRSVHFYYVLHSSLIFSFKKYFKMYFMYILNKKRISKNVLLNTVKKYREVQFGA